MATEIVPAPVGADHQGPTVLMSFPTASGTVEVQATGSDYSPYRWVCPAGCDAGDGYRALPFCRDDAKAHAVECRHTRPTVEVVAAVATYEKAAVHAAELAAQSASGKDLPAVDVRAWEFAEELKAGAKATLAAAGRLDLIAAPAVADVWLDATGRELLQESDLR